jgi:predicted nucleic acid-binding protein
VIRAVLDTNTLASASISKSGSTAVLAVHLMIARIWQRSTKMD